MSDSTFISSIDQAFEVIINMKNGNHLSMKASEIVCGTILKFDLNFISFRLHFTVIVYYENHQKYQTKMI